MQDIRERAAESADHHVTLAVGDAPMEQIVKYQHGVLRAYGVDLLMNLANAILPSNEAEVAAVEWLRGEIVKVAQSIPEA